MTETQSGRVEGCRLAQGVVFRGIPFAAAPVGELRFRPPEPPPGWAGVRDCSVFGPICPQEPALVTRMPGSPLPTMSEDCLSLNVWTPAPDGGRRPVMVFVHGGGFIGGAGSADLYDGASFARDGVVFVTFNYRLHAFGYLYLDELFEGAAGTGKLGILDQIAALRWVRDNIAGFGGDPDNVTVVGQSAGALSLGTILATPAAAGLARRAILQSGAVQSNMAPEAARGVAERLLEVIDVAPGDWAALQAAPTDAIVSAASQVAGEDARAGKGGGSFAPVFDGVSLSVQPFEALAAGAAAGVDLLLGACAEEWRLFVFGMGPDVRARHEQLGSKLFDGFGSKAPAIRKAYGDVHPQASDLEIYAAAKTDHHFALPTTRLAEAQLRHGANVYMYRFSWRSPVNPELGACHCLELPFIFETLDRRGFLVGEDPPYELAAAMHGAWVRFAASGDPNGDGLAEWPRYDTANRALMDFNTTAELRSECAVPVRLVWEGVLQ
jgi:para-nitrobenzyl esterase